MTSQQKKQFLDIGNAYLKEDRTDEAKDIFIELLKSNVFDTDFIFALSKAEFKLGNFHKSLYLIQEAIKIRPSDKIKSALDYILNFINENNIPEKLVTVSYIVKNEKDSLGKSLQNIDDIADEIIVVDTGSIDNTIEIAKSYGAKIYTFDWINDYSAARNISIKYATSKWILYLDADEELSKESKYIIRNLAQSSLKNIAGYICEIESTYINDKNEIDIHRGHYPRFFKNLGYPLINFFGRVHEQISPSFLERGYDYTDSKIIIKHHGYEVGNRILGSKLSQHIKSLSAHITEEPENGYAWYHLGNTLYQMKQYSECKEILENALKCNNLSKYLSANTALLLSRVEENLGNLNKAYLYSQNAEKYIPNYIHAKKRQSELEMLMGFRK